MRWIHSFRGKDNNLREMEGSKDVRRVGIMVMVVIVMFAGHANASLKSCYGPCFLVCMVESKKPFSCAFNCLKQCLSDSDHASQHYYCSIGCSLSECVELIQDPEKIEGCVENCTSNACSPKE